MFNSVFSFLRYESEILGQFPGDYSGIASGEQPVAECPLVKIGPAPSHLTMAGIWIPKNVLQLILRKLSPEELSRICAVCKVFNEVASSNSLWNSYDVREVFPNATFFTREDWKTYYGLESEQRGRPCVDKIDYIELKKIEARVEDGLGFTVIEFVPNDKISDVEESAANPKAGNPVTFRHFSDYIIKKLGEVQAKAVIVAMTNNVFIDSKGRSVEERKQILKDMKCKPFGILAATRLATMRFCKSPQGAEVRLFSDNPPTWTLCIDEKKDEATGEIVEVLSHFGGFALAGPYVDYFGDYAAGSDGVAGLREFKVIDETKNAISKPLKTD